LTPLTPKIANPAMTEKKLFATAMITAFDTAGASFSQALLAEGAKHE
jgi:hypothetical protein